MENQKLSVGRRAVNIVLASIIIVLTVASIISSLISAKKSGEVIYLKMVITFLGMMFSGILLACCRINIRDYTRQDIVFSAIPLLLFFTIFLSGVLDMLNGTPEAGNIIFIIQTLVYVLSAVMDILFWLYQCNSLPKTKAQRYFGIWIFALVIAYLVLLAVNPFTKILFFVDESGYLNYPGETVDIIFFTLLYLSFLVYVLLQRCSIKKKISVACFAFFPLLFIVLSLVWYKLGVMYEASALFFIFMLLAAYVVFFGDYIESKALLLQQKAELAEQKNKQTELQTALMLSQIRPHFLYNAITAIRNLCKKDPAEAYISLGFFADYLRGNMDALGGGRIVPFEKELEHVKTYLMLEQMRFGDELTVEYDIQYSDFSVPALTVQPIVENAVRHGATMNENGGKVIIRCVKTDSGACITVTDNGPGFDMTVSPSDGRNHFGLTNVRNCLEAKNCGELHVDSGNGTGTTVTILIWEEKE